jgi:hypothetical protein
MAEQERGDEAEAEVGAARAEVVASTLEALQARVERAHREVLRGALSHRQLGESEPVRRSGT